MNIFNSIRNNPEEWGHGEFEFKHRSGLNVWTANGFLYCQPKGMSFSLWNKVKLWRAYRWWCINRPIKESEE